MIQGLADFSAALSGLAASLATLVAAVRVGPNRHVTGIHWHNDTIITVDQSLPVQDSYSLILGNGTMLAARPGPRDPGRNIAVLRLETAVPAPSVADGGDAAVGGLVMILGAHFDGSPTSRLAMVHAHPRTNGQAPLLDTAIRGTEAGAAVIDLGGRLLGMATPTADDGTALIPTASLVELAQPGMAGTAPVAAPSPAAAAPQPAARAMNGARRGWLGVALQPITVPEPLVHRAGQTSGRMVVNITHGGPAEQAGLRVGDVLLPLNGYSTSGSHALRAFLGPDRIGTQIEVKLLRDGTVLSTFLTVASQPG